MCPPGNDELLSDPQGYWFGDRARPETYRSKEIAALVQAIRSRENRLVLGLPGMGVSNLLRFLVTRRDLFEDGITFAYLNCDALDDCADTAAFFDRIARELSRQGLSSSTESGASGYERLDLLVREFKGRTSHRVAIVVDQASGLLVAVEARFYTRLAQLTDLDNRFCFVLAATPLFGTTPDPICHPQSTDRFIATDTRSQYCSDPDRPTSCPSCRL